MATYYWVGGTGTWNTSTTTNWATSSGGTGGAGVPTLSDNVIFDSSSGSGTITLSGAISCASLNTTGSSFTFTSDVLPFVTGGLAGKFFNGDWRSTISTGNIGTLPLTTNNDSSNVTGTTGMPSSAHRYGVNLWPYITYTSLGDTYGFIAIGYFTPPATGTYTFYTSSDDGSGVWIGDTASATSGRTTTNAVVNNGLGAGQGNTKRSGTASLVAGTVYAIRIVHEEGNGGDNLTFSWSGPGIAETTDLSVYFKTPGIASDNLSGNYLENATGSSIFVNGNLTLSATTNWSTSIDVNILGTSTLTTNNVTIGRLIFDGSTLNLPSNTTTVLTSLKTGTINLNSYNLFCNSFISLTSNTRSITFGSGSSINLISSGSVWTFSSNTGFSYTGTSNIVVNNNSNNAVVISTSTLTEAQSLNFNINSGNYTLTDTGSVFNNLNFTGFSGTLNSGTRTVYGNTTLSTGMTITGSDLVTTFAKSSGTQTIISNGKTFDTAITMAGAGTLQISDTFSQGTTRSFIRNAGTLDLNGLTNLIGVYSTSSVPAFHINGSLNIYKFVQTSGTLTWPFGTVVPRTYSLTSGTFDLNNNTPSFFSFDSSNSNARTIAFGTTGSITLTGSGTVWDTSTATSLLLTGTPIINISNNSANATNFYTGILSGSLTAIPSVNVTTGTYTLTDTGSVYSNLNFTGFSGTIANASRTIYGNLIMSSTMTSSIGSSPTNFAANSGIQTITTNGATINMNPQVLSATAIASTTQSFEYLPGLAGKFFNGSNWRSVGVPTGDVGTLPLTTTNDSSNVTGTDGLPSPDYRYGVKVWPFIYFGTDIGSNYGGIWIGYFCPPTTGSYTFTLASDDTHTMWIGDLAVASTGRNTTNAFLYNSSVGTRTNSITLTAGTCYAIRITWEEGGGQDYVYFTWSGPGISTTNDLTQYFRAPASGGIVTGDYLYANSTSTVQLIDDLIVGPSSSLSLQTGTFNANNKNVTVGSFSSLSGSTRTLTMGSGLWNLTGSGSVWSIGSTNLSFNKNTSNIILSNNSTTTRTFSGGNLAYNKLTISGNTSTSTTLILGNNSFTELASDKIVNHTIQLGSGTNTTVNTWNIAVPSGNTLSLQSNNTSYAVLSKSGTGTFPIINTKISYVTLVPQYAAVLTNSSVIAGSSFGWIYGSNYMDKGTDLINKYVPKSYLMEYYPDLIPALNNGTLNVWGYNFNGQLGTNNTSSYSSPTLVSGKTTSWKKVSSKGQASAAIAADGSLWTWGVTAGTRSSPFSFPSGTEWKSVAVGYGNGTGGPIYSIKNDGSLWSCGVGYDGNLAGPGGASPNTVYGGGNNWKQVSSGHRYTMALKTDGTLWACGYNEYGQFGNGDKTGASSFITAFGGTTGWKSVTAGQWGSMAIKTDGTLWTCGFNSSFGSGQLGDGTTVTKSSPVTTTVGGNDWKSVNSQWGSVVALKVDGSIWMWGRGISTSPVSQNYGTNWKNVDITGDSSGRYHVAGIKTDGTLWTWGYNGYGQLGDSTTSSRTSPIQPKPGDTSWKSVTTGFYSVFAINDSSL